MRSTRTFLAVGKALQSPDWLFIDKMTVSFFDLFLVTGYCFAAVCVCVYVCAWNISMDRCALQFRRLLCRFYSRYMGNFLRTIFCFVVCKQIKLDCVIILLVAVL